MREMLHRLLLLAGTAALATAAGAQVQPPAAAKPRVVVTTDPELDDSNSLLRYLLHSTDFDTEALIYASSRYHWKGDGKGTKFMPPERPGPPGGAEICPCVSRRWDPNDRFVDDAVEVYEKAYPNLKLHDPRYPTPASLKAKIHWGNVMLDGDISEETDGSRTIERLLLDDRPGPVYLLAWGGQSTIARALKSIKDRSEKQPDWPAIRAKVSKKAIIQAFGDQDDTNAKYIKPNWPDIEYRQMATQTYGYGARAAVLPRDAVYLSGEWTRRNVSSRGPMGAHYRVWGDGKQMVKGDMTDYFGFAGQTTEQLIAKGFRTFVPVQEKGSWISEGDTSTFMNLIDNGLRGYTDASWGGWGGRNALDTGPEGPKPYFASARFFDAAQRDLAERFKWTVTPNVRNANHPPVVQVSGALDRTVSPGEIVALTGSARDPDNNRLTYRWWRYADADSYGGDVVIRDPATPVAALTVPADLRSGQTIHLIFEVTDDGETPLTRYQRVVLTGR